ncbi:MAG: hypothetical protein ACE5R4_16285 [Armatimonadota bacterium]
MPGRRAASLFGALAASRRAHPRASSLLPGGQAGPTRREGADFTTQAELAALEPEAGVRRASRGLGRDVLPLLIAEAVLSELEMAAWTGELPGGRPWSRQVWWRVALWEAFWRERDGAAIGNW